MRKFRVTLEIRDDFDSQYKDYIVELVDIDLTSPLLCGTLYLMIQRECCDG